MTEYDPADDARKCYELAIELRRQREAAKKQPHLFCGECDRYEFDPIFLDVERCSKCGELIEGLDDA